MSIAIVVCSTIFFLLDTDGNPLSSALLVNSSAAFAFHSMYDFILRTAKLIYAQLSFLDIIDNHLTSTRNSVETLGYSHGMKCF